MKVLVMLVLARGWFRCSFEPKYSYFWGTCVGRFNRRRIIDLRVLCELIGEVSAGNLLIPRSKDAACDHCTSPTPLLRVCPAVKAFPVKTGVLGATGSGNRVAKLHRCFSDPRGWSP